MEVLFFMPLGALDMLLEFKDLLLAKLSRDGSSSVIYN